MDPTSALQTIRAAIAATRREDPAECVEWEDVDDLVAHVEALDDWLTGGGFLPEAWCVERDDLDSARRCASGVWPTSIARAIEPPVLVTADGTIVRSETTLCAVLRPDGTPFVSVELMADHDVAVYDWTTGTRFRAQCRVDHEGGCANPLTIAVVACVVRWIVAAGRGAPTSS